MKKVFAFFRDIGFIVFILGICGVIFAMSTGKHFSVAGYQVLRVLTKSMEPAIPENTCIIIKEVDVNTLKVGDIITYVSEDPDIKGYYNTHRIIAIDGAGTDLRYTTQGDAIDMPDPYPVYSDQIVGIYIRELPGGSLLGKGFLLLSDNRVYFFVVMLPLFLCLLSYFWQIVMLIIDKGGEEESSED